MTRRVITKEDRKSVAEFMTANPSAGYLQYMTRYPMCGMTNVMFDICVKGEPDSVPETAEAAATPKKTKVKKVVKPAPATTYVVIETYKNLDSRETNRI